MRPTRRPERARRSRESGVVLIAVLWLVIWLVIMALSASKASVLERSSQSRAFEQRQAELITDAAIQLTLMQLAAPRASTRALGSRDVQWADHSIRVNVSREAERIDLNYADRDRLQQYLETQGLDPEASRRLTSNVGDWREANHFESIEEIRRVAGGESLTERQLAGLTVYTHTAEPVGADQSNTDERILGELLRLEACTAWGTDRQVCRRAIVRIVGRSDRPWQVFQWQTLLSNPGAI